MTGLNEQTILDIVERLRYRFFGKYRGSVTDVDASTLRIKAKVPAVLGEQISGGAWPAFLIPGKMSAWPSCPRSDPVFGSNLKAAMCHIPSGAVFTGEAMNSL